MSRPMTYADRRIVRAYADLKSVDAVIRDLGLSRREVADVVVNVCGINPHAARALLRGQQVDYLADTPTAPVEPPPRYEPKPTRPAGITEREYLALQALSDGLTYEQAATRLDRSLHTVRTHIRAAYHKLGVTTKDDAIRAAAILGIIDQAVEAPAPFGLTPAETETLRLASTWITSDAIGKALNVTGACVRSRLNSVYTKLGANGRREAVDIATRAGILDVAGDAA